MAAHIDGPLYHERMGRSGPVMAFEIIDKLNREINTALADPKIKARLAELGGPPIVGSPGDFGKIIADDTEKWAKVIKVSDAKPN
jgi:tripartite-type tricarboxylate transporter receptor subunit TctC